MTTDCPKGTIQLTLPAQAEMMLVLRLTTAGAVARAGLGIDRLDDVKLAVEEACACLIESPIPPEALSLCFRKEEGGLCICACAAGSKIPCPDEDELNVARCVLESLVDRAEFHVQDGMLHAICLYLYLD